MQRFRNVRQTNNRSRKQKKINKPKQMYLILVVNCEAILFNSLFLLMTSSLTLYKNVSNMLQFIYPRKVAAGL